MCEDNNPKNVRQCNSLSQIKGAGSEPDLDPVMFLRAVLSLIMAEKDHSVQQDVTVRGFQDRITPVVLHSGGQSIFSLVLLVFPPLQFCPVMTGSGWSSLYQASSVSLVSLDSEPGTKYDDLFANLSSVCLLIKS